MAAGTPSWQMQHKGILWLLLGKPAWSCDLAPMSAGAGDATGKRLPGASSAPRTPVSTKTPPTQMTWFWLSLGGWAYSSSPAGGLLQPALPSPSSQRLAGDPGMGWHVLLPRECPSCEGALPKDRAPSVSSMELTGHSCLGLSAGPGPPLLCQLSFW